MEVRLVRGFFSLHHHISFADGSFPFSAGESSTRGQIARVARPAGFCWIARIVDTLRVPVRAHVDLLPRGVFFHPRGPRMSERLLRT